MCMYAEHDTWRNKCSELRQEKRTILKQLQRYKEFCSGKLSLDVQKEKYATLLNMYNTLHTKNQETEKHYVKIITQLPSYSLKYDCKTKSLVKDNE